MARGVYEVEVVGLSVERLVAQRSGLRLDSYPALFLEIHRVKNLGFHLALLQAATALNQAVSQGRFAVINVRNDRKISDVIHQTSGSSD